MTNDGIQAALNIKGTTNGNAFIYFLKHCLCPLLINGDHVVIDNASIHKSEEVKTLIERTGAKLIYLPPYHPELNPIELAWNKIKLYLRKLRARTEETLYEAYAEALELITSSDAKRFFLKSLDVSI